MTGWGWRQWVAVVGMAVIAACDMCVLIMLATGSVRP